MEDLKERIEKLDIFQAHQNQILNLIEAYLSSTNGIEQLKNCDSFIFIATKIRFNLESTNYLINHLKDDFRFKTSINIIYRGVVDDVIIILYLLNFINFADPEQHALKNELDIMHKEYLFSIEDFNCASLRFNNLKREFHGMPKEDLSDTFEKIKNDNFHLLDETDAKLWKKNSDIRNSGSPNAYFKTLLKEEDNKRKGFMTEAKRLEVLELKGYQEVHQLKFLFKYYTQFHHYSPKSIDLINSDIKYDLNAYNHTLSVVLLALRRMADVLKFQQKDSIMEWWENVSDSFLDTLN